MPSATVILHQPGDDRACGSVAELRNRHRRRWTQSGGGVRTDADGSVFQVVQNGGGKVSHGSVPLRALCHL